MYKNILVPVDVFEIGLADKALSHAQFLAQSASGQIHLVHVNPLLEDYLINTAKEKLAELIKKLALTEKDIQIHIRSGNIRDEVTKLADELKADVVIIGSRNPNIQTHLLGSEAAGIVRYAHVPVFVVR